MQDGPIEANEETNEHAAPRRKPPKPVKHRWFDKWLIARSKHLKELVSEVTKTVRSGEQRRRARKRDDEKHHARMVEGVVCNLAYFVLMPPPTGWLAVNTRHEAKGKTRYDNQAFGKPFANLLASLAALGLLEHQLPDAIRGENSSIRPTERFVELVRPLALTFADFAPDPGKEVIVLTRVKRTYSLETYNTRKKRELVPYADTPTSYAYRLAVQELNDFLDNADIAFIDDGQEPRVDPHSRSLTRRFTVFDAEETRFDQVGRLFGGFWMPLKRERRRQIRIDGEAVAELDYASMFTRLAYAHLGQPAPHGDLYAIPGLEGHRNAVKLAMNCLLFDENPTRRTWPPDMRSYEIEDGTTEDDLSERLPHGWGVSKTKKAILEVHPALASAWGRGLGYRLMWQESEILLAALGELMSQNVPALELHDGLLVAVSKTELALEAMRAASKAVVGVELPCSVKG